MPHSPLMRTWIAILIGALALAVVQPVVAGQKDARLGPLFERLQTANDADEAAVVEIAIWGIWTKSENDDVNALMGRGVAAMGRGDFKLALAAFNRIIEIEPDFAEGWNKRATLFFLMRRIDDSVRDIAQTLKLEPRHFGALSGLGLINLSLGRDETAAQAFEQALEVYPRMPGTLRRVKQLREKLKGRPL